MRFSLIPALISIVLAGLVAGPASAASFEYLYIEASEGNSSGGHSAIQFGDEIYHYQHHDSGLIRLLRQDKAEFHFLYRFLQNRPIHLSHIEVSEETFTLLRDYFKLQSLAQDQQFKQLDAIHKDRVLLHRLLDKNNRDKSDSSGALALKGVGLFYAEQELDQARQDTNTKNLNRVQRQSAQIIGNLRQNIEQHYGHDYLAQRREQISSDIKTLKPAHWPDDQPILSKDHFPAAISSFADRYQDDLTGLIAIKILLERQPLRADAFFVTPESVSPEEMPVLQKLRDQLASSLLKSVNSGRPDWGYAVIVNLARLVALDLSLQSRRWVFIDDFAADSEWISADQFARYAEPMQQQLSDARANLLQTRKALLNPDGLTEANYSQLEMSANHYFELLKGKQHEAVRYIGEKALPTKSVGLPNGPVPELTTAQLTLAISGLDRYENKFHRELAQYYDYDLLTRNCVTELFRTIEQAFSQQAGQDATASEQSKRAVNESITRLGGNLSAYDNFIPFASFHSVQKHYNVTSSEVLNSYRVQQLEQLYTQQNAWLSLLRESNTLSSTLYDYNPDDAFFVFFTDGNPVLRPVFGLFNTAAGIGQSLLGVVSWPFDNGQNLKSGATGILMSLPEVLFFNMRKGSYRYLSYAQFINAEKTGY